MHQNTFWATSDIKNIFLSGHDSFGLEVCANASKHLFHYLKPKKIFQAMILVFWKYAQMHQNTFSTTSDLKKYFFFMPWIWWSGSMKNNGLKKNIFLGLKWLKRCFDALAHTSRTQESFLTRKISIFQAMILVVWKYAQMHQNIF